MVGRQTPGGDLPVRGAKLQRLAVEQQAGSNGGLFRIGRCQPTEIDAQQRVSFCTRAAA